MMFHAIEFPFSTILLVFEAVFHSKSIFHSSFKVVIYKQTRLRFFVISGETMSQNTDSVSQNSENHKKSSSKEKIVKSDPLSDQETSDREIKPKFIVGRKKYGRRSRPLDNPKTSGNDGTLTESDDEDDELSFYESPNELRNQSSGDTGSSSGKTGNKVKRSVSQSEMQESKRRRPISANRLKRCASLPPQSRNIQGRNRFVKDRAGKVK